jgi:tetratricopeptide (TPR) repeat protein
VITEATRLLQAGRLQDAVQILKRSCQANPEDPETWYLLARTYTRLSKLRHAQSCLEKTIVLQPEHQGARQAYGRILEMLGKHDAALDVYEQLAQFQPGSPDIAGCVARIYTKFGRYEAAWRTIEPIIAKGLGSVDVAMVYARICKYFGHSEGAINYLLQGIQHPGTSKQGRTRLRFHLGNLYDSQGEYEKAFSCFSEANNEKGIKFDSDLHEKNIGHVIKGFSRSHFQQMPRAENTSEKPVFVVGMPRSGTTLVEQILASHSAVYGGEELYWIPEIGSTLAGNSNTETPYINRIIGFKQPQIEQAAREYLHRLDRLSPKALRITDKMMMNFMNLGLINLLVPKARVIHCIRDPLDTCLSCYFTEFQEGNSFTYNLETLGRFYKQYKRLMRHWESVLDISIMTVRYEELVRNQEQITKSMVEFIDLDWEERCLRFHDSGRLVNTASYEQVRQPIYTRSIGRWRHYQGYLEPLKETLETVSP